MYMYDMKWMILSNEYFILSHTHSITIMIIMYDVLSSPTTTTTSRKHSSGSVREWHLEQSNLIFRDGVIERLTSLGWKYTHWQRLRLLNSSSDSDVRWTVNVTSRSFGSQFRHAGANNDYSTTEFRAHNLYQQWDNLMITFHSNLRQFRP